MLVWSPNDRRLQQQQTISRSSQGFSNRSVKKMNAKIFALFVIVLVECIYASSIPEENMIGLHEQMDASRVRLLEKKLREDIQRELRDIGELEIQLNRNLDLVHEKKRQLEIKRSQPVQCLVNAESCFLKK